METTDYLTRREAAELMSVTPRSVDRWARDGLVKRYTVAVGRERIRFSRDELLALRIPQAES